MQIYFYTGMVVARPEDRHGEAGMRVFSPGGLSNWLPLETFADNYRKATMRESQLLNLSPEELMTMAISDDVPPDHISYPDDSNVETEADEKEA